MLYIQDYNITPTPMNARQGYVYVIQPKGHNIYKIGCTTNLKSRMARLQRKMTGCELEFVVTIFTDDHIALEAAFHKKYRNVRLMAVGEWFLLTFDNLQEIIEVAERNK